jgi:hypothetical protein
MFDLLHFKLVGEPSLANQITPTTEPNGAPTFPPRPGRYGECLLRRLGDQLRSAENQNMKCPVFDAPIDECEAYYCSGCAATTITTKTDN